MAKYRAEIELSEKEAALFEEYLTGNCLDAKKWLSRQLYTCIERAASRYKQPKGKPDKSFGEKEISKKGAKKN